MPSMVGIHMAMTINISDWESDDWDASIKSMEEWIEHNLGNLDSIWPRRQELLHFDQVSDAIEFILIWA